MKTFRSDQRERKKDFPSRPRKEIRNGTQPIVTVRSRSASLSEASRISAVIDGLLAEFIRQVRPQLEKEHVSAE